MNQTELIGRLAAVDQLSEYVAALEGPEWLAAVRRTALEKFHSMTWPTTREEEWRRTNLTPFAFGDYHLDPVDAGAAAESAPAGPAGWSGRLHYSNASVAAFDVDPALAERGVFFGDITVVPAGSPAELAVRTTLEAAVARADNRLEVWNLALLASAAVLYVPRNVAIQQPFELAFDASGDESVVAPQSVVILESGASAEVVSRFGSAGDDDEVLVISGEQLSVGENSRLKSVALQRLNRSSLFFHNGYGAVARDGVLHRTEASLGANFVKSRFTNDLSGAGADVDLNGIYFAVDDEHMDLRTVQNHLAPRATSRAFYRGAVRDECHAIYQGMIHVAPGAPGTDAYLTNKNLVLSDSARSDSIPSLNIRTDDVRCSHGSTTGRLDPLQIFYLQTRGYSQAEARRLLVQGHFEDLIEQSHESVRDELRELVASRIGVE